MSGEVEQQSDTLSLEEIVERAKISAHQKIDFQQVNLDAHRQWVRETSGGDTATEKKNFILNVVVKNWERLYTYVVNAISNRRRT